MANTTKMTKKDYFKALLNINEVKANQAYVDFINHEIELLEKKNGNRKPTKGQEENANLKNLIIEELSANPNRLYTATEIMKSVQPYVDIELTNQKISALLRQLVENHSVQRITDKRKTYFKIMAIIEE